MNDYGTMANYPPPFTSFPQYPFSSGDRNVPAYLSHAGRTDYRGCPMDSRSRGTISRELDGEQGGGQPRRRIAVACARCRKRKIRCSGDPGNGLGCNNCRNAGADIAACQFHRVGSGDPRDVMSNAGYPAGYGAAVQNTHSHHNEMMSIYSASSPVYRKPFSGSQFPAATVKSTYTHSWNSTPFNDESQIENYGLGTTASLLGQDSSMGLYNAPESNLRWGQTSQRDALTGASGFMEQEAPSTTTYTSNVLPFLMAPKTRFTSNSEPFSPLNMTSFHSTLPLSLPLPDRHLPVPQSNRGQSTAEQLLSRAEQMPSGAVQPIRSFSIPTSASSATYTKAAMPWTGEGAVGASGSFSSTTSSTSGEIVAPTPSKPYASVMAVPDPGFGYVPVTATSSPEPSPTSTAPSLSYNAASSCESIPITLGSSYSNLPRQPISTSSDTALSRQDSCSNLSYTYGTDNASKRNSLGEVSSTEGTLVNGQRYSPLSQPQHTVGAESLRSGSFEHRIPGRGSVSSFSRVC